MDRLAQDILKMGLFDAQSREEETARFLAMIQRFAETLSGNISITRACEEFVRIIVEETHFENCSILLWDSERQVLSLCAAFGLEDLLEGERRGRYHRALSFLPGEGIAGRIYVSRHAAFIEDSAAVSIPPKAGSVVMPGSMASMPLLNLGVLNISARDPRVFTPQLRRNWEIVGTVLGYFILGAYFRDGLAPSCDPPKRDSTGRGDCGSVQAETPSSSVFLSDLAIDRIPQGLCLLDEEGKAIRLNKSIEKMGGQSASAILGRSPAVLFRQPEVFEELLARASRANEGELAEVQMVNHAGDLCTADIHLLKLGAVTGKTAGYLLVVNDVTQKKVMVEKALRTEKLAALGTMAGGVSHDFNNLLMAILGHVQLLLHHVTDEETRRRLQNLEKAVHDGSHTVRRLQKFTERDRDPGSPPVAVDVREAVMDVVELTRPRWKNAMEKSGHAVEFQLDLERNCMAAVHASDLREVLTNLIFNAIEAMPEGGAIRIKCGLEGGTVCMEVADSGIGMTKEVAAKVFDPFYTTKGVGNSGMGLSVSWSLVQRYGGDIQLKSRPGRGTTFLMRLPGAEATPRTRLRSDAGERARSCRLLIVDDDEEILGILRDMLRLKGHKVTATSDGERALSLIETNRFDLVLTDLGMPVVTGWEIARHVKEKDPRVPVVLITGWGTQYEEEDLAAQGVDLVLSKPLSWDKLLWGVEKMLGLRECG